MNPSLLYNLYNGLKKSGNICIFLYIIFLKILSSSMISLTYIYEFRIMENIDNRDIILNNIFIITVLWTIHQLLFHKCFILMKNLDISLHEFYRKKYLTFLLLESNLDWLNIQNTATMNDAIENGTNSLIHTLNFIINVINPLIQTMGSCIIIYNYIGFDIIYVIISYIVILSIGTYMLRWEFYKREEVNIKTNSLSSYNSKLSNSLIVNILNGEGKNIIKTIVDNGIKKKIEHKNITLNVQKGYTINELSGYIIILALMHIISNSVSIPILIAIYTAISNSLSRIWWLFHMFNDASREASEWGPLKDFLIKHIPKNKENVKENLEQYTILEKDNLEYKIMGESGKGKSTWMRQELIKLYRKYIVNWIYFDQNMVIPISKLVKIYDFINKDNLNISHNSIYHWAKILKLEKIINENTINKPFSKPSGGETKRIIILQKLLPILLNYKTIKIIFCDEITAGLDIENQTIIRNLIEILKNKYRIKIVNIDHHKLHSNNLLRLNVKITDFKVKLPKNTKETNNPNETNNTDNPNKNKINLENYLDFGYSKIKDNEDDNYLPPIVEIY